MDKHLARWVLTGDTDHVIDRILDFCMRVEDLSTPTARPGAVFLLGYVKEERAHGAQCSALPAEQLSARGPKLGGIRARLEVPSLASPPNIDPTCA